MGNLETLENKSLHEQNPDVPKIKNSKEILDHIVAVVNAKSLRNKYIDSAEEFIDLFEDKPAALATYFSAIGINLIQIANGSIFLDSTVSVGNKEKSILKTEMPTNEQWYLLDNLENQFLTEKKWITADELWEETKRKLHGYNTVTVMKLLVDDGMLEERQRFNRPILEYKPHENWKHIWETRKVTTQELTPFSQVLEKITPLELLNFMGKLVRHFQGNKFQVNEIPLAFYSIGSVGNLNEKNMNSLVNFLVENKILNPSAEKYPANEVIKYYFNQEIVNMSQNPAGILGFKVSIKGGPSLSLFQQYNKLTSNDYVNKEDLLKEIIKQTTLEKE